MAVRYRESCITSWLLNIASTLYYRFHKHFPIHTHTHTHTHCERRKRNIKSNVWKHEDYHLLTLQQPRLTVSQLASYMGSAVYKITKIAFVHVYIPPFHSCNSQSGQRMFMNLHCNELMYVNHLIKVRVSKQNQKQQQLVLSFLMWWPLPAIKQMEFHILNVRSETCSVSCSKGNSTTMLSCLPWRQDIWKPKWGSTVWTVIRVLVTPL